MNFQSLFQPSSLLLEAGCACEIEQGAVPSTEVETNAMVQLSQIYGTQVQGASIALIQVIGSSHQAAKKDTVLDSKHVGGFMRQNLATPPQYERIPIRRIRRCWCISQSSPMALPSLRAGG